MELRLLDDQLRSIEVIDGFESLIWAERFAAHGDFEMLIISTNQTRSLLLPGVKCTVAGSYYVMTIETVEKTNDQDGRAMIKVKGNSLEAGFKDRVAKNSLSNLTTEPYWVLSDTPGGIIKEMVKQICIDGDLDDGDIIPYLLDGELLVTPGSWYSLPDTLYWDDAVGVWEDGYAGYTPAGSGDTGDVITVSLKPQGLYEAITAICEVYGVGFRLIRNGEKSELYFEVYEGFDRSIGQDDLPAVVFSIDMDNLSDSSEFHSLSGSKNVAYVFAPNGYAVVYAPGVDPTVAGFERRVLYVDASDVELAAGTPLTDLLNQRGQAALGQNKQLAAFDGEISKFGPYRYGVDYFLGDVITLKNSDGVSSKMRVTEQILIHDTQGERSYPTLVQDVAVDPGSWYSLPAYLEWPDAVGYWGDAYYDP